MGNLTIRAGAFGHFELPVFFLVAPSVVAFSFNQAPLNFAYILFLRLRKDGIASELIERFVRKWFALSLLTARYSGSMENSKPAFPF